MEHGVTMTPPVLAGLLTTPISNRLTVRDGGFPNIHCLISPRCPGKKIENWRVTTNATSDLTRHLETAQFARASRRLVGAMIPGLEFKKTRSGVSSEAIQISNLV